MRRKLTLRSEVLGDLTADELAVVNGANAAPSLPLVQCVTRALRCAIYDPDSIVCRVSGAVPTCIQC